MAKPPRPRAVEKPPDVLGEEGRVELVAGMLGVAQRERFKLQAEQVANDLGDDDPAPGSIQKDDGSGLKTVAERRADLAASESRLVERFADYMPKVRERLNGRT